MIPWHQIPMKPEVSRALGMEPDRSPGLGSGTQQKGGLAVWSRETEALEIREQSVMDRTV